MHAQGGARPGPPSLPQWSERIKMTEIEKLKKKVSELKSQRVAFKAQSRLLKDFIALARLSAEKELLNSVLQRTLAVTAELTGAETGSLFLLDAAGVVTDSILTRGETGPDERLGLIGQVLDRGLAGWVKTHRRIGLIEDTASDERWLELPDQPYQFRSALAVPLQLGDELLGILTHLHSRPNHFTPQAADLMELCASQLGFALEAARLYSRLDRYSSALDAELQKGRKIQQDFLPQELPSIYGWEIAASFRPALQVSGDFFDAFITADGGLCLVIGDVCDKGIGSALFMALFRSLIRVFSSKTTPDGLAGLLPETAAVIPAGSEAAVAWRAITLTNEYIAREHGQEGMFATIFLGVLNAETGIISYVNAGHQAPLIIDASGVRHELRGTGFPVGILPGSRFKVEQAQLQPGQALIAYTDGVTEALSPEGRLYSRNRFLSLLPTTPTAAADLIAGIETDLSHHTRNAPQSDDITMIVVRRKPEACDPRC